ncbi:unnamed protein product [Durusdinium trenchii]|uniref:alpha-1,3-mannosyl-glycoprotein 2-beta-N-acetylglucosaminyltransferase n=2 Tax=Durusdinium trenchii TaxID=1381693 RepID=A0ABP0IIW4_9DINO
MIAPVRKRVKAKGDHDCFPCTLQRIVIIVLAAANFVVCIATVCYFRQLWRQPPFDEEFSDIDFSRLYDRPEHSGPVPGPSQQHSSTGKDLEAMTERTTKAPTPELRSTDATEFVPPASRACPICGNKLQGPMPTSLRGPTQSCTWKELQDVFLSDLVGTGPSRLSDMKDFCIEFGPSCGGVTCSFSPRGIEEAMCTARASHAPKKSPTKEVSFVKECKLEASNCDEETAEWKAPNPFAKDLHGTAIVILAHNRENELRSCLGSLLAMPEASLFRLHVSLDDPAAFTMMEGCAKRVAAAHNMDVEIWKASARVADPEVHNQEVIKWFGMNTGKIAHHYWVAFERAFMDKKFEAAVFVEEDLVFSPDFLALFRSTAGLLEQDPSLWCISGWNDFGFKGTASDPCRLLRTTYFPGLGFLLTRKAWLQIREEWPIAPTMGWDYWMRVAFRTFDKECIIPEVSRTHHAAAKGSSVTSAKQLRLFEAMAFADIPSSCVVAEPCNHFGNVSYLLSQEYEAWLRETIADAPKISVVELKQKVPHKVGTQMPSLLHVVPFLREEFNGLAEAAGLLPRNTKGSIPADLRSEHYGVMAGKLVNQRIPLLLVDKRSSRGYLHREDQLRLDPGYEVVAGARGLSCDEVCKLRGSSCDKMQLFFLNDCNLLRKHFPCEAGCAHQVGKELPVYVPDEFQPTYRQCLLTFISPMNCEAKHSSTSRLCACRLIRTTTTL